MASKPEQEQPIGGGDAPASPVNENIPVILKDDVKAAEALIREKYDVSPTPSKTGKQLPAVWCINNLPQLAWCRFRSSI